MIHKFCKNCSLEFSTQDYRKVFCGHSCAAKYNNSRKVSTTPCKNCKNPINKRNISFCSKSCEKEWAVRCWLNGSLDGNGKYAIKGFVRRYILIKYQNSCSLCGFSKKREDGSSILEIDHIDGNWQNSQEGNLRLLCPNCHHLTENFGARNMGNGRTWKKEYNQFKPKQAGVI